MPAFTRQAAVPRFLVRFASLSSIHDALPLSSWRRDELDWSLESLCVTKSGANNLGTGLCAEVTDSMQRPKTFTTLFCSNNQALKQEYVF
jgi:hypothetical protein